jgi:hypothetical protein
MKTNVAFDLPNNEDGHFRVEAATSFSGEEIKQLCTYIKLVERARNCTLLQKGMPSISGLKIDSHGLTLSSDDISNSELFELLHVLRPVTLEEEPMSYVKVASVLGKEIESPDVRSFIKLNDRTYRHGEMSLIFQVTIKDQPLFDESVLRNWLNGTQYHTDTEKTEAWYCLESQIGESNGRTVVLAQLHSKVTAIFNIDYLARQVVFAYAV